MVTICWILEILATIVEGYTGISIIEILGGKRFYGIRQFVTKEIAIGLYAVIITVLNYMQLFSWVTVIVCILLISISGFAISGIKFEQALMISLLFASFVSILEILLITIVGFASGESNKKLAYQLGIVRCVYLTVDKMITLAIYFFFRQCYKGKKVGLPKISFAGTMVVILSSSTVLVIFIHIVNSNISINSQNIIGISWILLLIFMLIVLDISHGINFQRAIEKKEKDIQSAIQNITQKYTVDLFRQKSNDHHNVHGQLKAINDSLSKKKIEEAKLKVQNLYDCSCSVDNQVLTQMPLLDLALRDKQHEAKEKNIAMCISVTPIQNHWSLSQEAICMVLVYMIDNALHNVFQYQMDKLAKIKITIKPINHFLLLAVAYPNSCMEKCKENISDIKFLLHKVGGVFSKTDQGGWVRLIVLINYSESRAD